MRKILILGVSGMLGNAAYRFFAGSDQWRVTGTARSVNSLMHLPRHDGAKIISGLDISDTNALIRLLGDEKPDIVLNCIGVIKQLAAAKDPLICLEINALFPHRLAHLCSLAGARLIHVSTDCVFSGRTGFYRETDFADADDLYGRTKLLGEVDYPNAVTLRTSIIGHEIGSSLSLIDWFLSEKGKQVKGFAKAIYSGFPTVELCRIIKDVVIPRPDLRGLWHVASQPINKYELLKIVAQVYGKEIELLRDEDFVLDRSLDGSRFNRETGYQPPDWMELVQKMHDHR